METKNTSTGFIEKNSKVIIIILTIVVLGLVVDKIFQYRTKEEIIAELEQSNNEKDSVTTQYTGLIKQYESMKSDNDTLNARITKEQSKIQQMVEEIKGLKSTNSEQLKKYKGELETLRKIMRNYVVQIDSLNTMNQALMAENKEVNAKYSDIKNTASKLETEKKQLVSKVEVAKVVKAKNIEIVALNQRGRVSAKIDNLDKVKVCFTLIENSVAESGERDVYIRISDSKGNVFYKSESNLFNFQGKEIAYSAKRSVDYQNKDVNTCIFWNVDRKLTEGTFNVDIFMDGMSIGTSSFSLR